MGRVMRRTPVRRRNTLRYCALQQEKSITSSREGLCADWAPPACSRDEAMRPSPRSNPLGARAVDRALPLRYALGDDLGRLHRRVAQLHVAGNLALDTVALAAQEVAQPLQLRDQLLDFQHRRTRYTLNQRIDLPGALIPALEDRQRPTRRGKFLTHEAADFSLDLVRRRGGVFRRPAGPNDVHA